MIIDASLLLDIQIRMSSSGYINVFQWNREWFFSQRVKFDSGFNVMTVYEVSWHEQKSFLASPASGYESGGGGGDPSDSPRKSLWPSPRIGRSRILISSGKFDSSICSWKIFFRVDFCASIVSNSSMSATIRSPYQMPPRPKRIRGTIQVTLSFQIDGFCRDRVILNQWTKRNDRSFKWLPKTPFIGRLRIK